jgi:hypothetical protein
MSSPPTLNIVLISMQTAKGQIAEAEALAEKYRAECDGMKSYMSELEAENKRYLNLNEFC